MKLRVFVMLALIITQAGYPAIDYARQNTDDDQKFRDLEAFLYDPEDNFDRIKMMDDVCLWINRYENKTRSSEGFRIIYYVDELFRRHFQEVDEKKIEILIYLVLHCGCLDESEAFAGKATEIFSLNPEIFVRALKKNKAWKKALDKMSINLDSLLQTINRLGDTPFENEAKEYAVSLQEARAQRMMDIEAFINDPVANLERIKGIDDICDGVAEYELRFIKDGVLPEFMIEVLFEKHFREIDEKKIEIVIHMVLHCGGGVHAEILADEAAKIFNAHPQMFVGVLEKTREWKRAIDEIATLGWPDFSEGLEKLGDSRFEKEIKKYVFEEIKRN